MALQFLHGQVIEGVPRPTTSFAGQTVIVTGSNSGLGLEACKHLARLKASTIIMGVRDVKKGEAARSETLASATNSKPDIEIWPLDLTSYASVAAFADRCGTLSRLDAAILNAGVDLTAFGLSEDLETTLTVNVVSTFLLAILLLPRLRHSASQHNITPHIGVTGSAVHAFADTKELTTAAQKPSILTALSNESTTVMKNEKRYFLSKLLVTLCIRQLAGAITSSASSDGKNKPAVILTNIAPGYCRTALFRTSATFASRVGLKLIGRSAEEGSRTLVLGVVGTQEEHGAYLSEGRVKKASPFVTTLEGDELGRRLWREILDIAEGVRTGCTREI